MLLEKARECKDFRIWHDPVGLVDTNPGLLANTRGRVDDTARKIIAKKFPMKNKKDEDVYGICEFEEGCWR